MTPAPDASMHPCYSDRAHRYFSRIHLPVAPKCNIQCNYCNRKFDCVNESRPGVTSSVISPEDALKRLTMVASKRKDLSVVGFAGPGDALANPEKTFRTIRLVKKLYPDLLICLSTNGLAVVDHIDKLIELDISHVTVTINTIDVDTALHIYSHVRIDGKRRSDRQAIETFLHRQIQGVKAMIQAGILVKVNSILMPGINDSEMVGLSKRLKLLGVTLHNISPLISNPAHGTLFGMQLRPTPSHEQLESVRKACGSIKQMGHCRQCRADAIGRVGEHSCLPTDIESTVDNWFDLDFGFEKRNLWRNTVRGFLDSVPASTSQSGKQPGADDRQYKIAVSSSGSGFADGELNAAASFYIYHLKNGRAELLNVRRLSCSDSGSTSEDVIATLTGCRAVIGHKIGYKMFNRLESADIVPFSDLSDIPIENAVLTASERLAEVGSCKSHHELSRAHAR